LHTDISRIKGCCGWEGIRHCSYWQLPVTHFHNGWTLLTAAESCQQMF